MPPVHTSGPWPPGRLACVARLTPGHCPPTPCPPAGRARHATTCPARTGVRPARPRSRPRHPRFPCGAVRHPGRRLRWSPSRPGGRSIRAADLLRARPGALARHLCRPLYSIHSDLSGFGRTEMDEDRDGKAASAAEAAQGIAAAAGTPYTFERRQESPADAILDAAGIHAAAEPASTPVIVTGRSHHVPHRVIRLGPGPVAARVALPGTHHPMIAWMRHRWATSLPPSGTLRMPVWGRKTGQQVADLQVCQQ